ncbi:putative reverse transcriptase domain-containing protein [Tanacetum coccineum]
MVDERPTASERIGSLNSEVITLAESSRGSSQPGPAARIPESLVASGMLTVKIQIGTRQKRTWKTPVKTPQTKQHDSRIISAMIDKLFCKTPLMEMEAQFRRGITDGSTNYAPLFLRDFIEVSTFKFKGMKVIRFDLVDEKMGSVPSLLHETRRLTSTSVDSDNILWDCQYVQTKSMDRAIELAQDLMDQKLALMRKAVTNMGERAKGSLMGDLCQVYGNTNVANTHKGNGTAPKGNGCFECGAPGHFKRDFPKLKNKDRGNGNAQGWVYVVGNAERRGNATDRP